MANGDHIIEAAYQIHAANQQTAIDVAEDWVRDVAAAVLRAETVAAAELTIAFVDDAVIHQVNRDHLGHDYPTDVISFLYDCPPVNAPAETDGLRGRGKTLDGELVVSAETARREALEYGWRPIDELTLYLVHGLLHLCGYDDQSETERALMRERERAILKIWDLMPHYGERRREGAG